MFIMLWQLNKLSEAQTNTFVFRVGCNNNNLELQDFQADFNFYGKNAEINLLTSYRPSYKYTQEQLDFFYNEGDNRGFFTPFIEFQHRPKIEIKGWTFYDSIFTFNNSPITWITNPYSFNNYPDYYDMSFRVDSVRLCHL